MLQEEKKRAVLIGLTGSGKTTLFNRLTGYNQKAVASFFPITQQIVLGEVYLGNMKFEIVDTPGFGADEDEILQVAGIQQDQIMEKCIKLLLFQNIIELLQ